MIPIQDVLLRSKIGAGGFGVVWRGIWRDPERNPVDLVVAIKQISKNFSDRGVLFTKESFKEAALWSNLAHRNICQFYGVTADENEEHYYLLSEYVEFGSLSKFIDSRKDYADFGISVSHFF